MDCPYCGAFSCANPNTGGSCQDCGRFVNGDVIDSVNQELIRAHDAQEKQDGQVLPKDR